ncbi:Uncharacterized protein DAT39_019314, partial [Clarias magur]
MSRYYGNRGVPSMTLLSLRTAMELHESQEGNQPYLYPNKTAEKPTEASKASKTNKNSDSAKDTANGSHGVGYGVPVKVPQANAFLASQTPARLNEHLIRCRRCGRANETAACFLHCSIQCFILDAVWQELVCAAFLRSELLLGASLTQF